MFLTLIWSLPSYDSYYPAMLGQSSTAQQPFVWRLATSYNVGGYTAGGYTAGG